MPERLTILHLVSLVGRGGRGATALRQARLLAARGHRVLLGCIAGSLAAERGREFGVEVLDGFRFRRGFRLLSFWHDCRLLAARCASENVDVVHAHLSQESWVACAGLRLCARKPAFIRSRGVVVPVQPHWFNRLLHNRLTTRVVAPSRVIYEHLRALPGFDPDKTVLLPDGVDITRFSPQADGAAVRREFNIGPDAPLVVMVARLQRVKGHEVFFKALARLLKAQTIPGLRALCACDERTPGEYEQAVRGARELGCPEASLAFTGLRPDVEKVIAAATVIALPSLGSEGSSRVALEAGASGVPIVASAVGCLPEVIQDGTTGIIVPSGDPDALAAGLARILQDRELAVRMGQSARKRIEELYDENLMAQRLEEIYVSALAPHAAIENRKSEIENQP
ncbi:MAG: glycosyltransferase family 4 protein [Planctomycetota bacterium]|nr:glycosyltransferase family 4 protein [Planctomycetota bacterium]